MKYLFLPIRLIEFWYPEAIAFFFRTWKNMMLFLEEDLAVTLMWKLLFIPLFHDSSIVGRILSFLFRLSRILIGLFAFFMVTIIIFFIAWYWLVLPIFALLNVPNFVSLGLFLGGLGLFILNVALYPHKKVWQVATENLFSSSFIEKKNLNLPKIMKDQEVLSLLNSLEIKAEVLPEMKIGSIEEVGIKALSLAKKAGSEYLSARHFFVAILETTLGIDDFLIKFNLKPIDFENALIFLEKKKNKWRRVYVWDGDFAIHHLKGVNRGWLGAPTPTLDLVGEDLTREAAKEGFENFLRGNSVPEQVINILSGESNRNVIIVGAPGVGKSSLIRHLAKLIIAGDAPPSLATKRMILLDLSKLVSGMQNQGDLGLRIKTIFEEVTFAQNVIITLEEIHELGVGEAGSSLNLYSLMQPYLESDKFQFIGTTEVENYSRILEKNGSFARIFKKVELLPATPEETLQILEDKAIFTESKGKVKITYLALKEAVNLALKLYHDRVLPDSAISIFEEAVTENNNGWVSTAVIKKVIAQNSKVPIIDIENADKDKLLNLENEIHLKMVGQEQAIKVVADTIRRSFTGLREEARPIGSFLFVGPTGVGKTELAKTLSEVFFNTSEVFVRFDMSEYQNPESVSRFLGENGQGGTLTEAVREKPYCLILLDEFEKADPKILTLFLQVLEDGRLTDGAGRLVDFTNTIIIATSNAASLTIAQGLAAADKIEVIDKKVNEELLKIFSPELINRFDAIVLFKPLSEAQLEAIVQIKITVLQKQMRETGYLLDFQPELITELARKGFDNVLGARPLRRLIQNTLEANLSKLILEDKLIKGQLFKVGVELL